MNIAARLFAVSTGRISDQNEGCRKGRSTGTIAPVMCLYLSLSEKTLLFARGGIVPS